MDTYCTGVHKCESSKMAMSVGSNDLNYHMDIETALEIVERERCRQDLDQSTPLTIEDIKSKGPVEYFTQYMTDSMRREAHKCIRGNSDVINSTLAQSYAVVWLDFFNARRFLAVLDLHVQLVQTIGTIIFPDNEGMLERFRIHDESKYSYEEMYGYVLKRIHEQHNCPEG